MLAKLCQECEYAAKANDLNAALSAWNELVLEHAAVMTALEALLEFEDAARVRDQIRKLKDASLAT